MQQSVAPVPTSPETFAGLVWPRRAAGAGLVRAAVLTVLGACLLTVSAKIQVPGPVPMTLQTLAVMALGAALGLRLAVSSVLLYIVQGALGMPVFASTPPLVPGLAYLMGPTGGFLLGFLAAAAIVGAAADRGLIKRPLAFAVALAAANLALLAVGCAWLALAAATGSGATGIGFARAYAVGVQPFLLANAVKLVLAAIALPLVFDTMTRLLRR